MKRTAFLLVAALAALLTGCMFFPVVEGSGILTTSAYPLAGFSKIAADQVCSVRVVPDTVFSVTVTCDDNLLPYLEVRANGVDSVQIGLRHGYNYRMVTFSADVHMPVLTSLDLSGASEARVDPGFSSSLPISLRLSGASLITATGLVCGALTADMSGASSLSVTGTAVHETVVASGASSANLLGCPAGGANVSLSGASTCRVDVGTGLITVSASGASTLYYGGNPAFSVLDLSGASRVVKMY
jgi:hypothetical protein